MIKYKKTVVLVISILLIITAITGCERGMSAILGSPNPNENTAGGGATVISSEVYLAMEKFRTLNPMISKDEDAYFLNKLIYESLFTLNENLEVVPMLAEAWAYSEDGKALSIQLKKGILWQDGDEFDGQDAVFSIDCYRYYPAEHLYAKNVENIENVVADRKDPSLITIYYRSADMAGLELLTFPILPKHLYKSTSALHSLNKDFIPVGTGPYMINEFDVYSHISLVGNPGYHGIAPTNHLIFQLMSDREDALNMLNLNLISYAVSKNEDRDMIYRNPQVNAESFPANECVWLGYNFTNPFLRIKGVRQAIAYAIDTAELLESCYFNSGIPSENLYFPGFLGINQPEDRFPADLEKAKELFSLSGFRDVDQDGFLDCYYSDGAEVGYWTYFSLKMLVNSDDAQRVEAAKMIQNWFVRIGLTCELALLEEEEYRAALLEGEFDLYLGDGTFNEIYDLRPLLHSAYQNPVTYENISLNTLLDSFTGANSPEKRQEIFRGIRDIVNEDLPYYCLLYKTYGAVASPALSGEMRPIFTDFYRGCEDWKCVYNEGTGLNPSLALQNPAPPEE